MSLLLDQLLSRVGKTRESFGSSTKMGKIFRRNGVRQTPDLDRVMKLPRRKWEDSRQIHAELTEWLKKPRGTMELRPIQAASLADLHDYGGLLCPINVGGGKTLVSLLASEVLEASRPLLLIPAKLKRKTLVEIEKYREYWRFSPPHIVTYEWLGRVQADDVRDENQKVIAPGFLRTYSPDLIIADECHKLRNKNAAVVRRVARYLKENAGVKFVGLSGTITKRSLRDYAHISEWALRYMSPLPLNEKVLQEWADALDEKVQPEKRLSPGALLLLCDPEEMKEIAQGRDGLSKLRKVWSRRFAETPGVITSEDSMVSCSLQVTGVDVPLGENLEVAFAQATQDWKRPDGVDFVDPVSYWRHTRQLACGFYYRWKTPGPKEWIEKRREWGALVRRVVASSPFDSELQVAQAIVTRKVKDPKSEIFNGTVYVNWRNIKDTFEPETEPVWLSDVVLRFCEKWMKTEGGIVWVEHVAFAERLAALTKRPFFHRKGEDQKGNLIDQTTPAGGPIIASLQANFEGRNLQAWNTNLVVSPPPTGSVWEQLLGREHRSGQEADEVSFDVILNCFTQWQGFEQARQDAKYIQDTTGQIQKLVYADVDVPSASEVAKRSEARWAQPAAG
jgi:hypothetical protein